MKLPENVNNLITRLEDAGFEAYAVGGCIRDSLMGLKPKDWDVCTSALPSQTEEVFKDCRIVETGLKHGTVTVFFDNMPVEITTFRLDGEYEDNRRPKSVEFTSDIMADLARRDFTVNAMAFNPKRGLTDPFGGRRDIEGRTLRAVGEPSRRFREDALRIMRGVRFCVTLGFGIDAATAAAMLEEKELLQNISPERIRDELIKALSGGSVLLPFTRFRSIIGEVIPQIRPCFDCAQRTEHHCYDVYTHILTAADNYSGGDPYVKLALLLHDIGKPICKKRYNGSDHFKGHSVEGIKLAKEILRTLRLDNASIRRICTLVQFHDVRLTGGEGQLLKVTRLVGKELMPHLFDVMEADVLAQSEYMREEKLRLVENGRKSFARLMTEERCCSLKKLAIDGRDIKGLKGRQIGAALHCCLNAVIDGRVENKPEALKAYVGSISNKWKT